MFLILFAIILFLIYFWGTKNFNYWRSKGVPGPEPLFLVGNMGSSLIGKKSFTQIISDIYRTYEGYSFVGIFQMRKQALVVRDVEFLKNILVKDFKHFQDNDVFVDKNIDRILGRNPFFLKGNEWKHTRVQLTSSFTSGKIKSMFPIMQEVSRKMVKYVEENRSKPLEAREICVRYTLDNVGVCAFGIDGKCFDEEYSKFRKIADDFLSPGTWQSFLTVLSFLIPDIQKYFGIRFVREHVENTLIQLVGDVLRERRKNNIKRNDFLDYVSEIFPEEIDIVAQAATFFADGYETSSRVMSFALFQLANHPDVQEKLRKEINEAYEKDNKFTYEAIQESAYLDACLCESMRLNPIVGQLFKVCTEKYTYTPTDPNYKEIPITLEPGDSILIPVDAIQKDSKYWEDPEKFIPERFLDKNNIGKFTFFPFGEGPRMCIGARFATAQLKLGMAQLVRNFKMTINEKTQLPLKFDIWFFLLNPIGGLWINFEKI